MFSAFNRLFLFLDDSASEIFASSKISSELLSRSFSESLNSQKINKIFRKLTSKWQKSRVAFDKLLFGTNYTIFTGRKFRRFGPPMS